MRRCMLRNFPWPDVFCFCRVLHPVVGMAFGPVLSVGQMALAHSGIATIDAESAPASVIQKKSNIVV